MLTRRRSSVLLAAICATAVLSPGLASADEWPSRPVTMIVPFSAGGSTDIAARLLAEELKKKFNQSFIVENRGGASGNLGVEAGARAEPDGYTLTVGTMGTLTTNQFLYKNMKFDAQKDFEPISQMFKSDHVLVVNPKVPAKSVKELIAYAKANPDKLTFGSSGPGSAVHMFAVLIAQRAGIKIRHIPYKGSSLALNDLVAGTIDILVDTVPSSLGQIRAGNTRALAVTTAKRNASLPDVPTMEEAGIPNFDFASWGALLAPKGTPKEIITKLHAAIAEAYAKPEVVKGFAAKGQDPVATTPEGLAELIKRDTKIWGDVVKEGHITVN
jgi:tripartite-type tricarboxylate transporter receptor subunit TctC